MDDNQKLSDDQKRRRVAEMLVKPLVEDGMKRKRGVKVESHDKWLEGLKTRLAYLELENLIAMRHGIARAAGGQHRDHWPSILTITNMAHAMQTPPDEDNRMVTSYMASTAGRQAWDRGPEYAIALRVHLRKARLVPNSYTWPKINKHGAEIAAKRIRISEQITTGRATPADMDWWRGFEVVMETVRVLVFAKIEKQDSNNSEAAA